MQAYILPAGVTGIAFSLVSYGEYFKLNCVADDSVLKDPTRLVKELEDNIRKCCDKSFINPVSWWHDH